MKIILILIYIYFVVTCTQIYFILLCYPFILFLN